MGDRQCNFNHDQGQHLCGHPFSKFPLHINHLPIDVSGSSLGTIKYPPNGRDDARYIYRGSESSRCSDVEVYGAQVSFSSLNRGSILRDPSPITTTVTEWSRYRIVAGLLTSSSPVPLRTRRVGERCTFNLSRAQTSTLWCRPRHLTMVQNYAVRRQKPSCS
ncbi:uncharacterized protein TNCV_3809891 [Trichonephila clavipes]|nr:uncharacterized protein TNCV_3809891 [Trichonephila clavipes]